MIHWCPVEDPSTDGACPQQDAVVSRCWIRGRPHQRHPATLRSTPRGRLDAPHMSAVRAAVRQLLTGHEPYPAIVVDRCWNLVDANTSVAVFTEGSAPRLLAPPINVLRTSLHPDGLAPRIVISASGGPMCSAGSVDRSPPPPTRTSPPCTRSCAATPAGSRNPTWRSRPRGRRRPAADPPRRGAAHLLQYGGHVRHPARHHRGGTRHRIVLPGRRRHGSRASR